MGSSQRLTRSGSAMQLITIICFSLSLLITPSSAFWIMNHHPLNFNARLDPIVNPGTVSGHTHSFVGSNSISASSDYNSLRSSSACTTSGVDADKSLYWTPTLYSYSKDADTFTAFPMINTNTYYLQRGNMKLQAFPPGLRMIAGNPAGRDLAPTKQLQDAVSFVCLNYKGTSPQTNTMPTIACPDGLRAQLIFPSCWDGKNLDSPDHKSHMAYPLGDHPDNGDQCPSTHPIRFVTLFYEFIWNVGKEANKGNWVFANGDAMGYAFHGDFMNGWTTDVLQAAINQCTGQLFNNLEGCAPFQPTLNRKGAQNCKVDTSKVAGLNSENVNGPLKRLPGCNTVLNGNFKGAGACAAGTTSPATNSSASASTGSTNPTGSIGLKTTGPTVIRAGATSPTPTGSNTVSSLTGKSSSSSSTTSSSLKLRIITGTSTSTIQTQGRTSTVTVVYTKTLTETAPSREPGHHRHHSGHHHKHHYKHKHHHKSKSDKWSKQTEAVRVPKVTPRVSTITGTTTEIKVYTSTVTYTDDASSTSSSATSLASIKSTHGRLANGTESADKVDHSHFHDWNGSKKMHKHKKAKHVHHHHQHHHYEDGSQDDCSD